MTEQRPSKEKSERLRAMVDKIKMRPEPMPGMTPVEQVEREFYERYSDPSRSAQPPRGGWDANGSPVGDGQ
jgi:hypothetical protein